MNDFCGRFYFALDMNGDGAFTITDVWLGIKAVWLLPAKVVVGLLHSDPKIAQFFELSCGTGEGLGGAIFSIFGWLFFFGILLSAISSPGPTSPPKKLY